MSRASIFALLALGAASAAGPAFSQDAGSHDAGADRYGPASAPPSPVFAAPPSYGAPRPAAVRETSHLRGRMLSWPGKIDGPALAAAAYAPAPARAFVPSPAAARGYRAASYRDAAYAPPASRYSGGDAFTDHAPRARSYRGLAAQADPREDDQPYALRSAPRAAPAPQRAMSSVPDAPAQEGWRPVFAAAPRSQASGGQASGEAVALAGPPARAEGLPTSIYAPAPTAPAAAADGAAPRPGWAGSRAASIAPPLRTAMADRRYAYDPTQEHSVRFYSVHRPFGLKPDAAPIPPQFFTATADLAEPPGPLPTDRTTVSGGTTHTSRVVSDPSAN